MELEQRNQMIVEHWIRVLIDQEFVLDLVLLMIEFSKFHEKFDHEKSDKELVIEKDGLIGRSKKGDKKSNNSWRTLIGSFVAKPDGKYKWKIRLINGGNICIGILKNEAIENGISEYWWNASQGYLWHTSASGMAYCEPGGRSYGDWTGFHKDDVITMCLNLKKYQMIYSKNNKDLGIMPETIEKNKEYRLAIAFYDPFAPNSVEILSLDVDE